MSTLDTLARINSVPWVHVTGRRPSIKGLPEPCPEDIGPEGAASRLSNSELQKLPTTWVDVSAMVRGAIATLALCGVMPDAVAGSLLRSTVDFWMPATALSLTLAAAVIRSQK